MTDRRKMLWYDKIIINLQIAKYIWRGDWGTEANIFYLLENDWEQGDDLAFLMIISVIFQ